MSEVTKPIALDESLNTTESTPRNIADVLASGLANIANNVKPDGSDISIDVPGMSATNVDDGFSELKGTLGDLSAVKAYTNAPTISFDMDEAPTATHFGAYILFNANQGVVALVKAETNPGVNVIIGSNPMTATLSGKTITITPTNRLWGLTVMMGCETDIT